MLAGVAFVVAAAVVALGESTFVFSQPVLAPRIARKKEAIGSAMANELEELLSQASASPQTAFVASGEANITLAAKRSDEDKQVREHFVAAQKAFDEAASVGDSAEQTAVKRDIASAMSTPATRGQPDRELPLAENLICSPDLMQCPLTFAKRGALCSATSAYTGPCANDVDLFSMTEEQKLAYARQCKVDFPCQQDCVQNFLVACPSLWRESSLGVCTAPATYAGGCDDVLETSAMSEQDKYLFGVKCGARWPCNSPAAHTYSDICPQHWTLQFGQTCAAPAEYTGPCEKLANMAGMTLRDKKDFEAMCEVAWPDAPEECTRDYAQPCPFAWFEVPREEGVECRAPLTYEGCSKVQDFENRSPAEKRDWEAKCGAKFPCISGSCVQDVVGAICPKGWYAFNGGFSCSAPFAYLGTCAAVLNGLADLTPDEKERLAKECGFEWPCEGETAAQVFPGMRAPRRSSDPARYSLSNGPIDGDSGAIAAWTR